jgi:predicted lipid-binding transport protein (Tim44 family)
MRQILSMSLLAIVAAISVSACSSSSNASNNAADATATAAAADNSAATNAAPTDNTAASSDNTAASDNAAAPAASDSGAATVTVAPIYPGAAEGARPKGVADGAPPSAKAYSTSDDLGKVRAWYQSNMKGVPELGANEKAKDLFLLGKGKTASVLMLQTAGGKTWIITGPAGP